MTSKERAQFRAQANTLEPLFQIGKGGFSQALVDQTADALRKRELIKLKVLLDSAPESPREFADKLAEATGSEVIQVVGGSIVLYKEKTEEDEKKKKPAKKGKPLSRVKAKRAAAAKREAAEKKCDELGMTYKFVNCYDVTQTLGIKGAQSFMKEDIARQLKNFEGKKIAAYCADISSQAELIKNACPNGIIVAGTSFPSVYDGYTAAFNIEMGKKWDDKSKVFSKVRAAIRENGGTKNQFIVWDDLTAVSMTDAAFEYARASLTGEQTDMAKAVKSSFPSKIKVSDKKLDKCTFIYTEDYRVL